ncbi:hypothetical protein R4144_00815 [Gordonia amicalis]|uniref:hypothetical protein n=1 Tax=Gordonia amicalis TaxID=89053 RepID=UPI0029531AF0|nr:hypothetical protein [Gordonia amicalis]MDV7171958.1 hypothetical protein [Gordonia amicalis]
MRILLLQCSPLLRRWPRSAREWQNHLPVLSDRRQFWSDTPQVRVDWAKTRRTGWPPTAFAIRRRHRSTDLITLSVLAWTLEKLEHALQASRSLTGPHTDSLVEQVAEDVETMLVRTLPLLDQLDESDQTTPTREDIRAVRASGWPWNAVAEVAAFFTALERGGADVLARALLYPGGFPETVFQLSALGSVLIACEEAGAAITSLRPIGYMTKGPVYRASFASGESWDLWCEAARCWQTYGLADRYRDLAGALITRNGTPFQSRNIRPDILLARPGVRALVVECKFPSDSHDPGYVAQGMYQASYYAHQLKPAFEEVQALAVGPRELVPHQVGQDLGLVSVGLASVDHLVEVVGALFGRG